MLPENQSEKITSLAFSSEKTTTPELVTPTIITDIDIINNDYSTPISTTPEITTKPYNDLEESTEQTSEATIETTLAYETETESTTVAFSKHIDQTDEVSSTAESTITTEDLTESPLIDIRSAEISTQPPSTSTVKQLIKVSEPITETTTKESSITKLGPEITDDFYGQEEVDYDDETTTITPVNLDTIKTTVSSTSTSFSTASTTTKLDELIGKRESLSKTSSTTTQSPPHFDKSQQPPVCSTAACKSEASRILSLMDHSADPCEDFYEFACGGMQVDNDDSGTWKRILEQLYLINNTAPPYLQTFRNFYDSCVSHEFVFDYKMRIETGRLNGFTV